MMKKTAKNALFVTILTILTSACSGDNSDLVSYINDIKSKKGTPIEPIPKFAPLPTFHFPEEDNRRSPFKPVQHQKIDQLAPDQKRVRQALEAYPLDALKFVGILKEDNVLWALIKNPDKKIVPVKVGNYMGSNYGRIISIKNNEIKLEEIVKDSGSWAKRITTINYYAGKQE
jgi:type IV pilus assembly protein PilP